MSEEVGKRICRLIATPKHREVWRNIALVAWIFGIGPSILAVVVINGPTVVFGVLMSINVVFLIINCSFCCVHLQTLKKKRLFYIICLIFMIANDTVLITSFIETKETESAFHIIELTGCGIVSISCLALVVLNVLLVIKGPLDPVAGERHSMIEVPVDLPQGYVAIRYVPLCRGRRQSDTTFQVEAGQVLNIPQPSELSSNTEENSQRPATSSRRTSRFGFRSRSRGREEDARNMPIRIISDGIINSERRDSAISLLRRASTSSIEYDTGSVICTCFYTTNSTADNDEEVPSYSETPTGNIAACPIHGVHTITPPPYEGTSAYNTLCSVLRLPKYDDVVAPQPSELSAVSLLAIKHSTTDTLSQMTTSETAATRTDATEGSAALLNRSLAVSTCFETIFEDGYEASDFNQSEQIYRESVKSTPSSNITDIPSTSRTAISPSSTTAIRSISSTTAVPSTSTTAVPSTSTTAVPSTSPTAVQSTSTTAVQSTSTTAVPSTSTTAIPSTSTTAIPSTSTKAIPSTSTKAIPSTSSTKAIHSTSTTAISSTSSTKAIPSTSTTAIHSTASTTAIHSASSTKAISSTSSTTIPSTSTTTIPFTSTTAIPSTSTTDIRSTSSTSDLLSKPIPNTPSQITSRDITSQNNIKKHSIPNNNNTISPTTTGIPSIRTTTGTPSTRTASTSQTAAIFTSHGQTAEIERGRQQQQSNCYSFGNKVKSH